VTDTETVARDLFLQYTCVWLHGRSDADTLNIYIRDYSYRPMLLYTLVHSKLKFEMCHMTFNNNPPKSWPSLTA